MPSSFPFYKVNGDGAIFKDQKEAGVEVVIRDHVGNFIAGLSKKFQCPLGAIEVEAKAFESCLEFAKNMDIQDFVLEGDSLNIVHALCGNSHATSMITTLIYWVQVASYEFQNVLFSHVRRNGNMPAHQCTWPNGLHAGDVISLVETEITLKTSYSDTMTNFVKSNFSLT
ncbi:uncharacterized protein LOC115972764 [Quercus lobata]|uniref:uncharacterized protein LOC115972764 n=1 Tax=Quercus lobata TaxID=97700 RepID=UPI00124937D6|nr:uncharacterized protein LOC115972764 [Quercus lobata]